LPGEGEAYEGGGGKKDFEEGVCAKRRTYKKRMRTMANSVGKGIHSTQARISTNKRKIPI